MGHPGEAYAALFDHLKARADEHGVDFFAPEGGIEKAAFIKDPINVLRQLSQAAERLGEALDPSPHASPSRRSSRIRIHHRPSHDARPRPPHEQ